MSDATMLQREHYYRRWIYGRSGEGCSFTLLVRENLGKTEILGKRAKEGEG